MSSSPIDHGRAHEHLYAMSLVRRFEERCAELYGAGQIRGFLHLYIGQEAVAVGVMAELLPEDNVVATYREHAHAILRGITPAAVMAEMLGKATGCSKGRGGSMHLFDAKARFYGGHAIVGGGLPFAVGLALVDSMQRRSAVTACFFGDGAVAEGEFHESLNLAALWKLPVLFVCENNLYAMGTAIERHQSDVDIAKKPPTYGIVTETVDGMDVLAVEDAARRAVAAVREGGGPRFLELRTYRFRAHSMYDAEKYRSKDEVAAWHARCPIATFAARLREARAWSDEQQRALDADVERAVEEAVAEAERAPLEPVSDLETDVYARPRP